MMQEMGYTFPVATAFMSVTGGIDEGQGNPYATSEVTRNPVGVPAHTHRRWHDIGRLNECMMFSPCRSNAPSNRPPVSFSPPRLKTPVCIPASARFKTCQTMLLKNLTKPQE